MELLYFDLDHAIKAHDKVLEVSGGLSGILHSGRLESILTHVQNDDYYSSFEEKLTHIVFSAITSHCFSDGNKRTSIALGAYFMGINGLDIFVDKFIIEMENICVHVANNLIDKELLQEIITSIIEDEDYSEELKLKIIASIG
ncbi:type II toxin-antitoxin system death-on-curing family toxin [Chitinophaga sancti]|uniref:Death on curing protein n=1 Tax=Chitinophaga sancti TaxID=1004 RepID=A0A1K1NZT0_9BACT|nr:type II toxin-antitoxin system death-on-curing family toxin [Chitinophaga sancti]WQD60363.1 type II toxin-antitoxin system death-on-curing family toxin [Chitinophaga sancti]WQG87509.1 type II toxin-antitoxin system death-on-curing family toxin [Chitinophaga sancti]SFW41034.1 death on curing protein [Chitinophaga sancti]